MHPSQLPSRYKISGKKLTGGGLSKILHCRDENLDREVVIKALQAGIDPSRLIDELSALQDVRSKHVVQIYDVIRDEQGEVLAIVEEYIPGNDLLSHSQINTATDLLKILYQVAEGISDIHRHGRIHRDIKPNNMKLDLEGCLKIYDFGLSRIEGANAQTTSPIGTRGFMAPELYSGGPTGNIEFTRAVDVFAFGAVALFLVKRDIPFDLKRVPPSLKNRPEEYFLPPPYLIPDDVLRCLGACLAYNPNDRPEMAAVRDVIKSHLLADRHNGTVVANAVSHFIDATRRAVKISVPNQGEVSIRYDGRYFLVTEVQGDAFLNNEPMFKNQRLSGSAVIVLGASELGAKRTVLTLDISHPEVTL